MGGLCALLAPFDEPQLADGVRAAVVPALGAIVVGVALRLRREGPAPVGGLVFAIAALSAYGVGGDVPGEVVAGVVTCALGGLVIDVLRISPGVGAMALVPGALLIAGSATVDPGGDESFRTVAVFVAIVTGGTLLGSFDRRWQRLAPAPALLALTAGGIYATVPDTELALASFGAALVVAALGWPLRLVRVGGAGAGAAVATLAWAVAVDGVGRDGSVVGALACLGIIVVDPAVRMLGERSPLRHFRPPARVGVLVIAHVAVVLWMSRVAGLRESWPSAAGLAAAGLAVAGALWSVGGRLGTAPSTRGVPRYSPRR